MLQLHIRIEVVGTGNSVALSGQPQAMAAGAKGYIKELESRCVDTLPVPFDDVYHFTGSGALHDVVVPAREKLTGD